MVIPENTGSGTSASSSFYEHSDYVHFLYTVYGCTPEGTQACLKAILIYPVGYHVLPG